MPADRETDSKGKTAAGDPQGHRDKAGANLREDWWEGGTKGEVGVKVT